MTQDKCYREEELDEGFDKTLCSKLLKAAMPHWLEHFQKHHFPLSGPIREKLLAISPAQINWLLRPLQVCYPRKGLPATKPCIQTKSGVNAALRLPFRPVIHLCEIQ